MKNIKQKIYGVLLLVIGYVPVWLDNDGTALVLFACFALPMIFSKENWFM